MRKLQPHDVFMALKVVRAAELREEVKRVAAIAQVKKENNETLRIEDVGIEFILGCLEKTAGTASEKAIYELLAGPLEMGPDEIGEMDLLEFLEKLNELIEFIEVKSFVNFFKSLAALINKLN